MTGLMDVQGQPLTTEPAPPPDPKVLKLTEVKGLVDKNCKKCFGRGREGFTKGVNPQPILCRCVFKNLSKAKHGKNEELRIQMEQYMGPAATWQRVR